MFIHSVRLDSVFPFKMLKNDRVCGGETYMMTQIQTSDSFSFCLAIPKEFIVIQVIILMVSCYKSSQNVPAIAFIVTFIYFLRDLRLWTKLICLIYVSGFLSDNNVKQSPFLILKRTFPHFRLYDNFLCALFMFLLKVQISLHLQTF